MDDYRKIQEMQRINRIKEMFYFFISTDIMK